MINVFDLDDSLTKVVRDSLLPFSNDAADLQLLFCHII